MGRHSEAEPKDVIDAEILYDGTGGPPTADRVPPVMAFRNGVFSPRRYLSGQEAAGDEPGRPPIKLYIGYVAAPPDSLMTPPPII